MAQMRTAERSMGSGDPEPVGPGFPELKDLSAVLIETQGQPEGKSK